jgi:hypothetical protein
LALGQRGIGLWGNSAAAPTLNDQVQYDRCDPFGIVHCWGDCDVQMFGDFCGCTNRYAAMP